MYIPGNFFLDTMFTSAGSGAEKGHFEGGRRRQYDQANPSEAAAGLRFTSTMPAATPLSASIS